MDDFAHLSREGYLSYFAALHLFSYLRKETAYIPWASALNNLDYLETMFWGTKGYEAMKNYLLDLLLPLYDSMGFETRHDITQQEIYKHVLVLAWVCDLGYKDCVENSLRLFRKWMRNPSDNRIINPNMRKAVYCSFIAEGGEEEWNFAWTHYLQTKVNSEKYRIMEALGCSKDTKVLYRYLEMAFTKDNRIQKEDALRVYSAVAKNPIGQKVAWKFFQNNMNLISVYLKSSSSLGEMIKVVSETFNTEEEHSQLLRLQRDLPEEPEGEAIISFDQALWTVNNNIAWMKRNYAVILQWLQDHGYSTNLKSN